MRLGFITCVRLGESCLEELADLGANLVYLGTLRDEIAPEKSGRIFLDEFARARGVALHKFRNMNDADAVAAIRDADLDWLYVIGWSQIAKQAVLEAPSRGVLGIHPTLLPEGRGRASIPWAIIKGLNQTGVTMFKLDEGMDTGPILGQQVVPVASDETASTLYEKVAHAHRMLIRATFRPIVDDTVELIPQDESRATEWPGRKPSDGLLNPNELTTLAVDRHVRALTHPYPGASIRLSDGRLLRIWAGTPGEDRGYQFSTADGRYTATEYDLSFPSDGKSSSDQ